MRRTFHERASQDVPTTLRRVRRHGWGALSFGGFIVVILIVGNVVAVLNGESLRYEDAAYRQPPQWVWLERLLYRPAQRVEPYAETTGSVDDLLGQLQSDAPSGSGRDAAPRIVSRPVHTATTERPYHYAVRTDAPADVPVRYEVSGPLGMTATASGAVTWTPAPGQVGQQAVRVRAVGPGGAGTEQRFTIIVSERFHPLGTDDRGRDLAAALVLGTRWTLLPGLVAAGLSVLLGTLLGGLAGYYGGRLDTALHSFSRLTEAFPALVLLFLAAVIFRFALLPIMAVLGLILLPGVARDVHARVDRLRDRQFVEAARELGLSDARILWLDVVWHNARDVLLQRTFYALTLAVVMEVTLSYLRIGIQPPTVSWGTLIYSGRDLLYSSGYWLIAFPALATALTAAGYLLLGRSLERIARPGAFA